MSSPSLEGPGAGRLFRNSETEGASQEDGDFSTSDESTITPCGDVPGPDGAPSPHSKTGDEAFSGGNPPEIHEDAANIPNAATTSDVKTAQEASPGPEAAEESELVTDKSANGNVGTAQNASPVLKAAEESEPVAETGTSADVVTTQAASEAKAAEESEPAAGADTNVDVETTQEAASGAFAPENDGEAAGADICTNGSEAAGAASGSSSACPEAENTQSPSPPEVDPPYEESASTTRLRSVDDNSPSRRRWISRKERDRQDVEPLDEMMLQRGLEEVKAHFLHVYEEAQAVRKHGDDLRKMSNLDVCFVEDTKSTRMMVLNCYIKLLQRLDLVADNVLGRTNKHHGMCEDCMYEAWDDATKDGERGILHIDNGDSCDLFSNIEKLFDKHAGTTPPVVVLHLPHSAADAERSIVRPNDVVPRMSIIPLRYSLDDILPILMDKIKKECGEKEVEGGWDGPYMRKFVRPIKDCKSLTSSSVTETLEALKRRRARRIEAEKKGRSPGSPESFAFTKSDLLGPTTEELGCQSDAWVELQQMIGMEQVKESIRQLLGQVVLSRRLEIEGKPPLKTWANRRCFIGPPGTGKTTAAKLYGRILKELGLLENDTIIEKRASDFIGSYVGVSEGRTKEAINEARGGVLIIDDFHLLLPDTIYDTGTTDVFRAGIIDTIVANVDPNSERKEAIILIGYPGPMAEAFEKSNPGLARRFPLAHSFRFAPYGEKELAGILRLKLNKLSLTASDEAIRVAENMLAIARHRPNFGNGGDVGNLVDAVQAACSSRCARVDGDEDLDMTLLPEDFDPDWRRDTVARERCADLFGDMEGIQDIIDEFQRYQAMAARLRTRGHDPRRHIPWALVFRGPPGTGKTTVARKMAKVYYDMGFLAAAEVIECSVADLTSPYESGKKVIRMFERALGKVLFIDEAYRLGENQAVDTIGEMVDCMTKERFLGKLVVVLAGYKEDMEALMRWNRGLRSRFATVFDFKPMDTPDALKLLRMHLDKMDIVLCGVEPGRASSQEAVLEILKKLTQSSSWANGRDIIALSRTIIEEAYTDDRFHPTAAGSQKIVYHARDLLQVLDRRLGRAREEDREMVAASTARSRSRFEHTGSMGGLDRAVDIITKAVDTTPQSHPDRAERMAAPPWDDKKRAIAIADIERGEARAQQVLSSGLVPPSEEVALRFRLSKAYVSAFEDLRSEAVLHYATRHLQDILRKAPRSSPDYPTYLDLLCHARTLQYMVSRSSSDTIDMAVDAGRDAFRLAKHGSKAYLSIVKNLASALTNRYALSRKLEDLDEGIKYLRMAYEGFDEGSEDHAIILSHLVSQIRFRVGLAHDSALEAEAETLVKTMAASTAPGFIQHGIASGLFGVVASMKATRTRSREDFDEALRLYKTGLEALPPHDETREVILANIVIHFWKQMISEKDRDRDRVVESLQNLIHYSALLIEVLPDGSTQQVKATLDYSIYLYASAALVSSSMKELDNAIHDLTKRLPTIPSATWQREKFHGVICDLLARRYKKTENIRDYLTLLGYYEFMLCERDVTAARRTSPSELPDSAEWVWQLKHLLVAIVNAPVESELRRLATRELADNFALAWKTDTDSTLALEDVYKKCHLRLRAIADAIEKSETVSERDISHLLEGKEKAAHGDGSVRCEAGGSGHTGFGEPPPAVDEETSIALLDLVRHLCTDAAGRNPYEITGLRPSYALIAREARLEQQSFEKARAAGGKPNLHLCRMCRDVAKPLRAASPQDEHAWATVGSSVPFGDFSALCLRTQCVFCRLVLSAITTEAKELHPSLVAIDEEFQGTQLTAVTSPGGDSMLEIRYGLRTVGTARLVTPNNYGSTIRQLWEFGSGGLPEVDVTLAFKHALSYVDQQANPPLIKGWLQDCSMNHGARCKNGGPAASAAEEMPMQHDSLLDVPFPKTIRDAMRLVESVGERYLWVDAICMVQDDQEQMGRDIPKMNIVYGQAFATIVALHGDSAEAGLPGVSPGTRRPQHIELLVVSKGSPNLDYDPDEGSGEVDTLDITLSPWPLDLQLDVAKWNTRGWIFQEHLLSRRCLFFTRDTVYFQCARHTLSEYGTDAHAGPDPSNSTTEAGQEEPAAATAPWRGNALDHLPDIPDAPSEKRLGQIFNIYASLVETYTRREFSLKSDIVNGFAGVLSVLEKHLGGESHAGLPAAVLAHALLWAQAEPIPLRGMRLATLDDVNIGSPDRQFPSWSWAGWDGPVEYRLFGGEGGGDLPLPTLLLSDCKVGLDPCGGTADAAKTGLPKAGKRPPSPESEAGPSKKRSGETTPQDSPVPCSPTARAAGKLHDHRGVQWQNMKTRLLSDPSKQAIVIIATPPPVILRDRPPESNFLSFTAPVVPVSAFSVSLEREYLTPPRRTHVQGDQAVCKIHDRRPGGGRHCGLWWEQGVFPFFDLDMPADAKEGFRMAGISAHPDAERRRRGPSRVKGEVDLFDEQAFPSTGQGSGLVNILVISGGTEEDGYEAGGHRVTVAVMHMEAWEAAGPTEKRVRLW
ncbi:hypothetical protein RB595_003720 [Gaeumannomyces hyphopodioides]